jgi:RNA polymerase sigma-70 factor (ECF subfamily)
MSSDLDRRERFEAVVDVVYEPLQRYFGRRTQSADVSDLLNDALLVIWRRLDSVPADHALPWSYGIAKRCLANHRRGERRRLRLVGRLVSETGNELVAQQRGAAETGHPGLEAALDALDDDERELVRLWAWEQLEPRELAMVLDMTPNAVSLRLTRAKKKLVSALERQNVAAAGQEGLGHRREPRP